MYDCCTNVEAISTLPKHSTKGLKTRQFSKKISLIIELWCDHALTQHKVVTTHSICITMPTNEQFCGHLYKWWLHAQILTSLSTRNISHVLVPDKLLTDYVLSLRTVMKNKTMLPLCFDAAFEKLKWITGKSGD